jgi:eukaryotic-like serine/threonine-protein kinase
MDRRPTARIRVIFDFVVQEASASGLGGVESDQRIGDYSLIATLKSGGMATLYRARKVGAAGFARDVAIKVVHPHLAEDEQFIQMFIEEGHLSARIRHPNVIQVEELGFDRGMYFIAMEYVSGCSLAQLQRAFEKRQKDLSFEAIAYVGAAIADGLHAAHELRGDGGEPAGVVHRDVSPQNILLSDRGHVKVIDFGIAKARGRSQQTQGGMLKGKYRYMSPEQAQGLELDRRSDVFSIAIVLWELITQRKLFDAPTDVGILAQVVDGEVRPPSEFRPDIPPALEALLMRTLSVDVAARPADAKTFRAELLDAVPGALRFDADDAAQLLEEAFRGKLPTPVAPGESSIPSLTALPHRRDSASAGRSMVREVPPESRAPRFFAIAMTAIVVGVAGYLMLNPSASGNPQAAQTTVAPPPVASSPEAPVVPSTPIEAHNVPTTASQAADPSTAQHSTLQNPVLENAAPQAVSDDPGGRARRHRHHAEADVASQPAVTVERRRPQTTGGVPLEEEPPF